MSSENENVNVIEGTDPLTVNDLIKWLSILRDDGVIFKKDGTPFSPLNEFVSRCIKTDISTDN